MTVETAVGGVTVGVERPLALLLAPVVVAAVVALVRYRADGLAGRRSRRLLLAARVVAALLLVLALASPYTAAVRETSGQPQVTVLADRSDSVAVLDPATDLDERIEAAGVPASVVTVGNGTRSRLGDGLAANLRENGSVVVVSDGQVTDGRSLSSAGALARSLNATVSAVELEPRAPERHVTLEGPSKTSVGVRSTFLLQVDGVQPDDAREPVEVTVSVDGEEIASRTFENGTGATEVTHVFTDTGPHRIVARAASEDRYERNDVYRSTVRVVEQPSVLYVSRVDYPMRNYLDQLYDVTTARRVPDDLSGYYAVVVHNTPARRVGNVTALQSFVIDGGGLVTVGGPNAFDRGGYDGEPFGAMQPVGGGASGPGTARLVLAVDVSGSTQEGLQAQKAVALDVLSQLGDRNEVGLVAFNFQPYAVASPRQLGEQRGQLRDQVRRLQSGGATDISAGLRGANDMLGDERGTVILISDGVDDDPAAAEDAARRLRDDGTSVIAVGVGDRTNEPLLRRIASESGGQFLRAGQTDRLRLLYGGGSRSVSEDRLTVINPDTFVTSGVELTSNPGNANDVSTKASAELLVADPEGNPAVARWRYGLGRVLSITVWDDRGGLDGLLQQPDSLLVTKSVNYAVGDPERLQTGVADASDTRVGERTRIVFRGARRPTPGDGIRFRRVGEGRYEATVVPDEQGFGFVAGAEYAVNYPAEYAAFGQSAALDRVVRSTGGRTFDADEAESIAAFARQRASGVREVRDEWAWLAVTLAFLVFLTEVIVRRVQVYRGRTRHESGLP